MQEGLVNRSLYEESMLKQLPYTNTPLRVVRVHGLTVMSTDCQLLTESWSTSSSGSTGL